MMKVRFWENFEKWPVNSEQTLNEKEYERAKTHCTVIEELKKEKETGGK